MNIYYDLSKREWFHTFSDNDFSFGADKLSIACKKEDHEASTVFPVSFTEDRNLGPLIGIMTSSRKDKSIAGNRPLFKKIQRELMKKGGVSVVFTPENVDEKGGEGFLYLPFNNRWISIKFPLPHLVYNRVPFHKTEELEAFLKAIELFRHKDICFFNPAFLNKYELYTLVKDHTPLNKYFPETILIDEGPGLHQFLQYHSNIYLKPSSSSQGRGIFQMKLEKDGAIQVIGIQSNHRYPDFQSFWDKFTNVFKAKEYIAQKGVSPALYNGYRYDFRILAHFSSGEYIVTGVGIRQSRRQNITTHIPKGGKLLSYDRFKNGEHEEFIQRVVQECGKLLSNKRGFFGEFSIDAGLTDTGEYVIYEINSKPMSFDEEEIEQKRICQLCQLFYDLTKFQK